jgi:hypothetical protein
MFIFLRISYVLGTFHTLECSVSVEKRIGLLGLYDKYKSISYGCYYFLKLFRHFLPWNEEFLCLLLLSLRGCRLQTQTDLDGEKMVLSSSIRFACRSVHQINFVHNVDGKVKNVCRSFLFACVLLVQAFEKHMFLGNNQTSEDDCTDCVAGIERRKVHSKL